MERKIQVEEKKNSSNIGLLGLRLKHYSKLCCFVRFYYLKQEQPSLAMLSTGTTVHSTNSKTSCFSSNSFDSSRLEVAVVVVVEAVPVVVLGVDKLENQDMTSSVVLPMHCLKLEAATDHSCGYK